MGFPAGASGKEPACQCKRHKETWVWSQSWEDPLEEGMATHSSILAWRTPRTKEHAAAAAKSLQSCLTLRPQRRQPTRLPRPWDSPGKNDGVGCHFLLQCMKVKSESEGAQSCLTLSDPMDCSPLGSSIHGIFHGGPQSIGLQSQARLKWLGKHAHVLYNINHAHAYN